MHGISAGKPLTIDRPIAMQTSLQKPPAIRAVRCLVAKVTRSTFIPVAAVLKYAASDEVGIFRLDGTAELSRGQAILQLDPRVDYIRSRAIRSRFM